MGKSRAAFSLVELLVALGIIIVLAALAAAGTRSTSLNAKSLKCLNNLRAIGIGSLAYAAEHGGQLPQSTHQGPSRAWGKVLRPYLDPKSFRSPLDATERSVSYAINDYLTEAPYGAESLNYSRLHRIPKPSETLLMALVNPNQQNIDHFHFAEMGYSPPAFQAEAWTDAVHDSGHYLFVDGHVVRRKWTEIKTELTAPGSQLIRPNN